MKFTVLKKPSASKLVKRANSQQSVTGYSWNSFGATVLPNFSLNEVLTLVENEPVATGAIQTFVDKVVEGEWSIVNWRTKKYDESTENNLRYKHSFESKVLRKIAKNGKFYKNVFLEIVRGIDGITPTDFNVLDSTNINPQTEPNGDPISYRTKTPNPSTGEYGEWDAKDIVWFKFDELDGGWAPVDLKALYTVLLQKRYINRFVSWCWSTGQYRVVHNFKAVNDDVIQDFVAYNSKVDSDFTKPFIASGDYVHGLLRDMKEIENLELYLKYLDNQILVLLRVPPIDVGVPDASGRSNADAQNNSFSTHVQSFKKVIMDGMNEFFRKINKGNNTLVFGPADRFSEKMVFDVCLKMKQTGFTDDAIQEYLFDKGMTWSTDKLFETYEDPKSGNKYESNNTTPDNSMGSSNRSGVEDLSAYPSREVKSEGERSESLGTGEEGSTREDQLTKRSYDPSKYYYYDIVVQE